VRQRGWSEVERLYEGLPYVDVLRDYVGKLNEEVGLDLYSFDLGVWSFPFSPSIRTTIAMQGSFDREEIVGKLLGLEYKADDYDGITYYWLHEDFKANIRHPLRHLGVPLNRIAFVEDQLLTAPATEIVEKLIDVQQGKAASLLDSKPHATLAKAVGEGLMGGVFVTPQWIVDAWTLWYEKPVERLDRYMEGSDRWGVLSPYAQVLLGYRVRGDVEETVIALYYPDPAAAGNDAEELERRWSSFHFDPRMGGGDEEVPVVHSCRAFSTKAIAQADASVLLGTCPVIRTDERDPRVKGPALWLSLFLSGQLQFLARDLEELKEASGQK